MAAPTLQDFALAFHVPHFHITVPALPQGATGVWWICDPQADSPLADFALNGGDIDTGCQPEADETWYGRIAWGTADGPLSDPSPTHEARA
jgi:hypothetical protein